MSLTIQTQNSEFTLYDYRSFYFDAPLLGSCYARAQLRREGLTWLDLWWGDDERTGYNLSIGKWCMTHDLPRWLLPKRYALKAEKANERTENKGVLSGYSAE